MKCAEILHTIKNRVLFCAIRRDKKKIFFRRKLNVDRFPSSFDFRLLFLLGKETKN